MKTNRKWVAVAALAVLTTACTKRVVPRQISEEAATAFGHAQVNGLGGALVLDVDALRELGFRPGAGQEQGAGLLVDLAVQLLPTVAAGMKDEPAAAAAMARSAVLLRLVSNWAKLPELQRVGVVLQVDPLLPKDAADGALVLLAVKEGEAVTRELLQGLGAAVRAGSGRDLVRTEQGTLCTVGEATPKLPFPVCVAARNGLFAVGTAKGLERLSTASIPAPREPGAIFKLVARVPKVGRIEVTLEGRAAVRVEGKVEADEEALARKLEEGIRAGLKALDAQAERRREVVATALGEVKGSLAQDAAAPAGLKAQAATATVEQILDPRGEYAAVRSSVQVARTDRAVRLELTLPEGQIRQLAAFQQGMTAVTTLGILSAIAIPNFLKYQCRSKASEGPVLLKAALDAAQVYRARRGKFPDQVAQLENLPAPAGRYALCLRSGCTPAASPAAGASCHDALADAGGGPKAPGLCVAGEPMGDGKLDVWVIDASGQAAHVRDGCQ